METVLVGFADALRRHGVRVSTAEVVDAASCAAMPGMLATRSHLEAALRCCLVTRLGDQEVFDSVFALYFHLRPLPHPGEGARAASGLVGEGGDLSADDLDELSLIDGTQGADAIQSGSAGEADMREFFDPDVLKEGTNLDDDADIADLASMSDEVSFSPSGASSSGTGMKVQLDVSRSRGVESPGSLSPATGHAVDLALDEEDEELLLTWLGAAGAGSGGRDVDDVALQGLLERLPEHLAEHLRRLAGLRRTLRDTAELTPSVIDTVSHAERDRLEEALRRIAVGLSGGLSQRKAPHARGRVDPVSTVRGSMKYGGIPFSPVRVRQVRERPRVVVLADVSLSVRATARFTLHVVHGLQSLLGQVRSFAFVDELVEVSDLFEKHPVEHALGLAFGGDLLDPDANSDYGSVFAQFLEDHGGALDNRTSVLVFGDGRSNGKDPGHAEFAEITRRARTTIWLTPEPSHSWGLGACAMPQYAPLCDRIEVVRDLAGLEVSSHSLAESR